MKLQDARFQFEVWDLFKAPWTLDRGQLRNADGWAIGSFPHNPAFAGPYDRANTVLAQHAPELAAELAILVKRCERLPELSGIDQAGMVGTIAKEAAELLDRLQDALEAARAGAEPTDAARMGPTRAKPHATNGACSPTLTATRATNAEQKMPECWPLTGNTGRPARDV